MGDFEGLGLAQNLNALIKVLPVQIHEVCGLVFAEAACEVGLVVDLGLVGFVEFLMLGFCFWIFGVVIGPLDGGEFEEGLTFAVGDEVGFGDFECPGADFVEGEGRVGFDFLGSDQGVVAIPTLFVGFSCQRLNLIFLLLFLGLARDHWRQKFLFAHLFNYQTHNPELSIIRQLKIVKTRKNTFKVSPISFHSSSTFDLVYIYYRMLSRLISNLAFGFYKTKWTHYLPRKHPTKALQTPFKRWLIISGDTVQVRTGDDRGKVGKVVKVLRKMNRVVVRGVNVN